MEWRYIADEPHQNGKSQEKREVKNSSNNLSETESISLLFLLTGNGR